MNYEKMTVAQFGVRLRNNVYKNVTAARRAAGKADFSFLDRDRAYDLVNKHFKVEATKAKKPKSKRRKLPAKTKKRERVALPPGHRRLDWDPIGSHVGTEDIDELAQAIAANVLARIVERFTQALGTLLKNPAPF